MITVWLFLTFGKWVLRSLSPQWIIPFLCVGVCGCVFQTRAPTTDAHADYHLCSDGNSPCSVLHCLAVTDTGDALEMLFFFFLRHLPVLIRYLDMVAFSIALSLVTLYTAWPSAISMCFCFSCRKLGMLAKVLLVKLLDLLIYYGKLVN